jgi:hypothetical protein
VKKPRFVLEKCTVLVALTIMAASPLWADSATKTGPVLPEGQSGIAAEYRGDRGIENDRNVLFVEKFDGESLDAVLQEWEDVKNKDIMTLSSERPGDSGDQKSLLLTHVGGQGTGGYLYRRLGPGFERVFFRFYAKIDPESSPIHHFVHLGGYHPMTRWPQGGAGDRPKGDDRFTVGIEPHGSRWAWDYYTYWMEMRGSPPRGKTWGNSFIRDEGLKVRRGSWTCLETMVSLNRVGDSDGEMALWIDGKLVSHLGKGFPRGKWVFDKFMPGQGGEGIGWNDTKGGPERFTVPREGVPFEGFRWRKSEELNLNFIWMLLYITEAPEGKVSRVWFDNVVVAREYIGPMGTRKRDD